jgi:protein TonB
MTTPTTPKNQTRVIDLPKSFGISGLAHALVIAAFLLTQNVLTSIPPREVESLQIDLFGLLSDRQVEENLVQPEPEEPPPMVENVPEPEPIPQEPQPMTPETVVVEKEPLPTPTPKPKPVRRPAPKPRNDTPQVQQTISQKQLEATIMRQYTQEMARKIRANIVYPPESKLRGHTGEAKIAFIILESGRLKPNSVKVNKSSGHKELDQAAMRAVQSVGVFPKPPKVIDGVIAIHFSKDS